MQTTSETGEDRFEEMKSASQFIAKTMAGPVGT